MVRGIDVGTVVGAPAMTAVDAAAMAVGSDGDGAS